MLKPKGGPMLLQCRTYKRIDKTSERSDKVPSGIGGATHPCQTLLQCVQDNQLGEVEVFFGSFAENPL